MTPPHPPSARGEMDLDGTDAVVLLSAVLVVLGPNVLSLSLVGFGCKVGLWAGGGVVEGVGEGAGLG